MANSSGGTPRGLPGFLRRSMRTEMDVDVDVGVGLSNVNVNGSGDDNGHASTSSDGMNEKNKVEKEETNLTTATASNVSSLIPSAAMTPSKKSDKGTQGEKDLVATPMAAPAIAATPTAVRIEQDMEDVVDNVDRKFRLMQSPVLNQKLENSDSIMFDNEQQHQQRSNSNNGNGNGNSHSHDGNHTIASNENNFEKDDTAFENNGNTNANTAAVSSSSSSLLNNQPTDTSSSSSSSNNQPTKDSSKSTSTITSQEEKKTTSISTNATSTTTNTNTNTTTTNTTATNNNNNNNAPTNSNLKTKKSSTISPKAKSKKSNMNYKEIEFEKTITEPVVNIAALRKMGWNGIPAQHRPQAWKILLGYLPTNKTRRTQTLKRKRLEYLDIIKQHYDISDNARTNSEQETLRQVLVDVPRTAPDVPLFRNDLVRQSLSRLLYIWACRHPASSYVQGINDLATPLISVFLSEFYDNQQSGISSSNSDNLHHDSSSSSSPTASSSVSIHEGSVLDGSVMDDLSMEDLQNVEADVYWCLTNLLAGIQDHYTSDQPGVQRMVMRLEDLVNRMDGELTQHLRGVGVEFIQFAFRWMNCLLLREFKLECVIRLWDTYLSEGDGTGFAMGFETFHVYVCAAFLCQFSDLLRNMEFDELFGFMQNVPTNDWGDGEIEILLSQAFVLSTLFHGSDAHLTGQNH